jgi:hypothetical protein
MFGYLINLWEINGFFIKVWVRVGFIEVWDLLFKNYVLIFSNIYGLVRKIHRQWSFRVDYYEVLFWKIMCCKRLPESLGVRM